MKKTGEHIRVNFGQSPFVFDIDGMMAASIPFLCTDFTLFILRDPFLLALMSPGGPTPDNSITEDLQPALHDISNKFYRAILHETWTGFIHEEDMPMRDVDSSPRSRIYSPQQSKQASSCSPRHGVRS
jgi:hypothetical protein